MELWERLRISHSVAHRVPCFVVHLPILFIPPKSNSCITSSRPSSWPVLPRSSLSQHEPRLAVSFLGSDGQTANPVRRSRSVSQSLLYTRRPLGTLPLILLAIEQSQKMEKQNGPSVSPTRELLVPWGRFPITSPGSSRCHPWPLRSSSFPVLPSSCPSSELSFPPAGASSEQSPFWAP